MAGEPGDGFAEVGPRNHESVRNAVAVFVESRGFELMFGGSEQQLKFLRFVETVSDELPLQLRQLRYQFAVSEPSVIFFFPDFLPHFLFSFIRFSFSDFLPHLFDLSEFLPQTIGVPFNPFLLRLLLPNDCLLQVSAHFAGLFARQSVVPFLPVYFPHQLSLVTHAATAKVLLHKLFSGFSDTVDELFLESQDFGKDLSAPLRPFVDHFRDFLEGAADHAPDVDVFSAGLAACVCASESIWAFLVDAYFGDFLSLGTHDVRVLLSETVEQRLQLFVGVLASLGLHFANTYFSIMNLSNINRTYIKGLPK